MDPFGDEVKREDAERARRFAKARLAAAKAKGRQAKGVQDKGRPTRITLPKPRVPSRDELARPLPSMRELAEFVGEVRSGLNIPQAQLAVRAGVSRQWLVSLESGRPTVEAGKVIRTLEALGFELVVTPYDPPPPWMLRAVADAHEKKEVAAVEARRRRQGRRAREKLSRLAGNVPGERLELG